MSFLAGAILLILLALGPTPWMLLAAARLWPSQHVCPDPVRGEATSYRSNAWRTLPCPACRRARIRRIASISMGAVAAAWIAFEYLVISR